MKTSATEYFRSIAVRIALGLVLASMIGVADVAPVLARDNDKRMERHDSDRNEHRGRGYDRDRNMQGRRDYRPYGYGERVYIPPPVIYVPPQPPGIRIFFPPIFIR